MNTKELNATVKISGKPVQVALTLFRGMSYVVTLTLENAQDLNDIISWSFAIDSDFDHKTALVIVADNEKISAKDNVVTIPISATNTNRLSEVIGTFREQYFKGQLLGFNSNAEVIFSVLMTQIRIVNNLDGKPPTENISEYYKKAEVNALISSCGYENLEDSTQNIKGDICVDFGGSNIRVYDAKEAVSGVLTFSFLGFLDEREKESLDVNATRTVETWIPASDDIETIIFPEYVEFIGWPDDLSSGCPHKKGFPITYHVFTARYAQVVTNGVHEEHIQLNYCYSFGAGSQEELK